ncbi:BMP-binding endothelial regulator protein-like [Saccoglossus kowalevskii]|uniref:BMP-binding endothelial regulator protein-like isoform X2 n=1 Tax=Saccoglossus kowalevskii TaxID=10224 RepID=A0ABM0M4X4_SACKO|nr:PREDICTED: BMP-binding endothelial regulator protein-like isoform X2 [Saccoglossus kowalevskii]
MRIQLVMLVLAIATSEASRMKRHTYSPISVERFAKYNVIVTHRRLGDCTFELTFLREDTTPPDYELIVHYGIDDSVAKLEYPIDTGSITIGLNEISAEIFWDPPEGFVPPFDVAGVTQASNTTGGEVTQHTMDDGPCTPASTRGDPHLRTFDGHGYSFQGLCWYTLAKHCTENPDFEISTEFAPRQSTGTALRTRAVKMNVTVGDETIIMDTDNDVTVNGKELYAAKLEGLPRNVNIVADDSRISIRVPMANLDILWEGRKHSFSASIYHPDYKGKICGLLGNADGDPLNDFEKSDGWLTYNITEFGESWNIAEKRCDYK